MTGPVTTEALVEKLARHYREDHAYLRSTAEEMAQALVAGPLAPLLAALQQVTAERDEARAKIDAARVVAEGWPVLEGQETLAGKIMTLAAAARQATLGERGTQFVLQHLMRALDAADTATSELARLRAEGEAKDRRIARLEEALAPFAKAGELFGPRLSDDYDQSIYAPAAGPEFAISADHLRAARAATAREGA